MRRFKQLLEDVRNPGPYTGLYPEQPLGTSAEDAGSWRVQCLLMNAEIRYSLYLQLLEDWVSKRNRSRKSLSDLPLPPWYEPPPHFPQNSKLTTPPPGTSP